MADGRLGGRTDPSRVTPPAEDVAKVLARGLRALAGLQHPDYVARFLIGHEIRGQRFHPAYCPVAKYLRILVPATPVMVTFETTTYFGDGGTEGVLQNPAVVMAFVHRFDIGDYSQLQDPEQHYIRATETPSLADVEPPQPALAGAAC